MNNSLNLRKFLLEKGQQCIHSPAGLLKHEYVTPTYGINPGFDDSAKVPERSLSGHYLQMYDWDACFFSQVSHYFGKKELGLNVVKNFLGLQEEDGYIPRTVSPQTAWDQGDLCKPFLAQTVLRSAPEAKLEAKVVIQLHRYLAYFGKHRQGENKLYHWRNVLESGVDDNLALIAPIEAAKDENSKHTQFPDGRLLACDLNAYLYAEFGAMSQLAGIAGHEKLKLEYASRQAELLESIEANLWNAKLGLYCNLDPESGRQVEIRSWTGFTPLLFAAIKAERVEEIIRKNILAEEHFLRPCGIVSMAASEPLQNQSVRGLYGRAIVSNWQGPLWVLPNALVCRSLRQHGFNKEADLIAKRVVDTLCQSLAQKNTLYENYDAETGKPLWAPQFISWNSLALELIESLE